MNYFVCLATVEVDPTCCNQTAHLKGLSIDMPCPSDLNWPPVWNAWN